MLITKKIIIKKSEYLHLKKNKSRYFPMSWSEYKWKACPNVHNAYYLAQTTFPSSPVYRFTDFHWAGSMQNHTADLPPCSCWDSARGSFILNLCLNAHSFRWAVPLKPSPLHAQSTNCVTAGLSSWIYWTPHPKVFQLVSSFTCHTL